MPRSRSIVNHFPDRNLSFYNKTVPAATSKSTSFSQYLLKKVSKTSDKLHSPRLREKGIEGGLQSGDGSLRNRYMPIGKSARPGNANLLIGRSHNKKRIYGSRNIKFFNGTAHIRSRLSADRVRSGNQISM